MARRELAARLGTGFAVVLLCVGAGVSSANETVALQLAVTLNSRDTQLIAGFSVTSEGRVGASPSELEAIGIAVDSALAADGEQTVWLADIPGLTYDYSEANQSIDITLGAQQLAPQHLSMRPDTGSATASGDWGAVLNYDLRGSVGLPAATDAALDLYYSARAFSPFGLFEQSGMAGLDGRLTRLDTTYQFTDPGSMVSFRAGDYVADGLSWTRPIRLGGLDLRHNFETRPDLVTAPQLTLGGTALVPSTVDVFLNGTNAFSAAVNQGPFTVDDIPAPPGNGDVTLVVTGPDGKTTLETVPFRAVPGMLRPGLSEWSIAAGVPRRDYGFEEDSYSGDLVGLGSLRMGILDTFTLEAHAEGGAGIYNGGLGGVVSLGEFGALTGAAMASTGPDGSGGRVQLSWQNYLYGLNIGVSGEKAFGAYADLASATARDASVAGVPRDRLSFNLAAPIWFDPASSVGMAVVLQHDADGARSDLLTASFSKGFEGGGSLALNGYRQLNDGGSGVLLAFSMPLDGETMASTAVGAGSGGLNLVSEVSTPLDAETGSVGWRLRDIEGEAPFREAALGYRGSYATIGVSANQNGDAYSTGFELRGAVAMMPGTVQFSNWIHDGFAIVDAGVPGVAVSSEHHVVGTTGPDGKLLLPDLQSYQRNRISIDPQNLPADAEVAVVDSDATPAYRSGTMVTFSVARHDRSALVTFVDKDGVVLPAGAIGTTGAGDEFAVGYDGEAYIDGLSDENSVTISYLDATCTAAFSFAPEPGQQVKMGPVACR